MSTSVREMRCLLKGKVKKKCLNVAVTMTKCRLMEVVYNCFRERLSEESARDNPSIVSILC